MVSKTHAGAVFRAALAGGLCAAVMGAAGCELPPPAAPATQPASRPADATYDRDYVEALGVANFFCEAWRQKDVGFGRTLLSRRLIRRYPDRRINDAIGGPGGPRHGGFHIFGGRRLGGGRIEVKVRWFFLYDGQKGDRIESPLERLVLAKGDDGQWRVDEFPIP